MLMASFMRNFGYLHNYAGYLENDQELHRIGSGAEANSRSTVLL